jgi:hypothetical protein
MKRLIIILLILSFAPQINGQSNLWIKKDKKTGILTKSTFYDIVGTTGATGTCEFRIIQTISKDTTMRLYLRLRRSTPRCFGSESKLIIKTSNDLITLKLSGKEQCGKLLENYADLNPNELILLKQNEMLGIKVQYQTPDGFLPDNEYADLFIRIYAQYFIKSLKYFEK